MPTAPPRTASAHCLRAAAPRSAPRRL